jgi:hypothetical protein
VFHDPDLSHCESLSVGCFACYINDARECPAASQSEEASSNVVLIVVNLVFMMILLLEGRQQADQDEDRMD